LNWWFWRGKTILLLETLDSELKMVVLRGRVDYWAKNRGRNLPKLTKISALLNGFGRKLTGIERF
jgi:hypothetical protein